MTISPNFEVGFADAAAADIREASGVSQHEIAIITGSGWGGALSEIGAMNWSTSAHTVSGFSRPLVSGHTGMIQSIYLPNGKSVLAIGARTHLYENSGVSKVVHPVRTAAACGARIIVLTNGAGSVRQSWRAGQAVMISDHINLTATSPLEGAAFVDLTDLYSRRLRDIARSVDSSLEEGVYVQFRGPHYETPAEVQMAKAMGGHIIGMSTALEAIAAREAGLEVLGLSLVTNLAAGISPHPLSHQEVIDAGESSKHEISRLLASIVNAL